MGGGRSEFIMGRPLKILKRRKGGKRVELSIWDEKHDRNKENRENRLGGGGFRLNRTRPHNHPKKYLGEEPQMQ